MIAVLYGHLFLWGVTQKLLVGAEGIQSKSRKKEESGHPRGTIVPPSSSFFLGTIVP